MLCCALTISQRMVSAISCTGCCRDLSSESTSLSGSNTEMHARCTSSDVISGHACSLGRQMDPQPPPAPAPAPSPEEANPDGQNDPIEVSHSNSNVQLLAAPSMSGHMRIYTLSM